MIDPSRVRRTTRRALISAAAAVILATIDLQAAQELRGQVVQAREPANAQAAAQQDFQKRLDAYLALREAFSKKLKPLSPTADAAELTARQEALAAALQTTREHAKQGDLIPKLVAVQIAETVVADYQRRNATAKRGELQEVPVAARPAINRTYPAQAALPTVPPLLLANLPRLPDNLQYRFYGRHVVILDGDVQIIVDYIANVLPPH
jgi:hypothetical protein